MIVLYNSDDDLRYLCLPTLDFGIDSSIIPLHTVNSDKREDNAEYLLY
jgi:hypothetical protein